MVRTQIQLTEEHSRRLRKLAREQDVSLAEMIRRCIVHYLKREVPTRRDLYARAAGLVGAFEDRECAADVGAEHDRYLDGSLG